jgi:hypothetical protein
VNEQIGHAYAHCKCRVTGTAAGGGPSAATDEFALPLAFIDLRDFTVSAISRAVLQSLGGSPSEMIGRPALDLSQPTDRGRAQSLLISMRDGGIDFFRARHTIESVNGPVVATHWARSITFQDRKVAMFEFAVGDEHVPSPIMAQFGREPAAMVVGTLDAAGTVTDISANTLMALGLVPRSFIGHPLPARSKDGAPATLASPDVLSRYEHSFSVHVHLTDAAGSPVPFCGVVTALAAQPAALLHLRSQLGIDGARPR